MQAAEEALAHELRQQADRAQALDDELQAELISHAEQIGTAYTLLDEVINSPKHNRVPLQFSLSSPRFLVLSMHDVRWVAIF